MTVRHFYRLAACAVVAGYAWIAIALKAGEQVSVCLIRNATGLPCPSCGSTRAVLSILQGDVVQAMWWNPLGFLLSSGLVLLPAWLAFDGFSGKWTMWNSYRQVEGILSRRQIAIPFICLVIGNWIWNIMKHL